MKTIKQILFIAVVVLIVGNIIFPPPEYGDGPPTDAGEKDDEYYDESDDARLYRWNDSDSVWIKTNSTQHSRDRADWEYEKKRLETEKVLDNWNSQGDADCNGPGSSACKSSVRAHVNSQQGKEVNYISHAGKGVFDVNIVDVNRGNSYSAKFYTDCNCNVSGTKVY